MKAYMESVVEFENPEIDSLLYYIGTMLADAKQKYDSDTDTYNKLVMNIFNALRIEFELPNKILAILIDSINKKGHIILFDAEPTNDHPYQVHKEKIDENIYKFYIEIGED